MCIITVISVKAKLSCSLIPAINYMVPLLLRSGSHLPYLLLRSQILCKTWLSSDTVASPPPSLCFSVTWLPCVCTNPPLWSLAALNWKHIVSGATDEARCFMSAPQPPQGMCHSHSKQQRALFWSLRWHFLIPKDIIWDHAGRDVNVFWLRGGLINFRQNDKDSVKYWQSLWTTPNDMHAGAAPWSGTHF